MYGHSESDSSPGRDMTIGHVRGVCNTSNEQCEKGLSFVGFKSILEGGTK